MSHRHASVMSLSDAGADLMVISVQRKTSVCLKRKVNVCFTLPVILQCGTDCLDLVVRCQQEVQVPSPLCSSVEDLMSSAMIYCD